MGEGVSNFAIKSQKLKFSKENKWIFLEGWGGVQAKTPPWEQGWIFSWNNIINQSVKLFQDLTFVDTLVNLTGVIIECLDFSIPGLFAMATTAAGKSPNTTPTKWNKRLQKPMGNFTSLVHMIAKLLAVCKRTNDCKVSETANNSCGNISSHCVITS